MHDDPPREYSMPPEELPGFYFCDEYDEEGTDVFKQFLLDGFE